MRSRCATSKRSRASAGAPGFKKWLATMPRSVFLTAVLEDLPVESNRVDLDPDVRDERGTPVPRITRRQHANDLAMHAWFRKKLLQIAAGTGAEERWTVERPGETTIDEAHSMPGGFAALGTCRMGENPESSVVDRRCRAHDVPNLWVVDGSTFPTAGGYAPGLTILANAYRAAAHPDRGGEALVTELSRRRFLLTSLLGSSTLAGLGRLGSVRPVAAEEVPEELVTGVDRETVVALMSRIIPKGGEGDSPGALEANCVGFLAALLADVENPFRDVYRIGLEGVAAVCDVRFGKSFVELAAKTQDEVLRLIEAGDAEGWPSEGVGPADFFEALRTPHDLGLPRRSKIRREPALQRMAGRRISGARTPKGRSSEAALRGGGDPPDLGILATDRGAARRPACHRLCGNDDSGEAEDTVVALDARRVATRDTARVRLYGEHVAGDECRREWTPSADRANRRRRSLRGWSALESGTWPTGCSQHKTSQSACATGEDG